MCVDLCIFHHNPPSHRLLRNIDYYSVFFVTMVGSRRKGVRFVRIDVGEFWCGSNSSTNLFWISPIFVEFRRISLQSVCGHWYREGVWKVSRFLDWTNFYFLPTLVIQSIGCLRCACACGIDVEKTIGRFGHGKYPMVRQYNGPL